LGRTPTSAEEQGWIQSLENGASQNAVAMGFLTSGEYRGDLVQSYYKKYLNRTASAAEVAGWVSSFTSGATNEQVQEGFLDSAEFYNDSGATNSGFVTALYKILLARTPSAAEVQGWVTHLTTGETRGQVALGFLTSAEYRSDLVQSFYQTYLKRTATSAEIAGWVSGLNGGDTDEQVQAGFLSSAEFYDDVTE
jgi:hypothetical protein